MNFPHPELPPIAITASDSERLSRLIDALAEKYPETTDFLAREIERAQILPADEVPPGLVVMGSDVTFRDDATGEVRRATLVYPAEADIAAGKISVLSPIGAALIGMSVGHSIETQTPSGGSRTLTVLNVA
ncbi:nucleoside diphosphate kinase regulator [Bradyrhizobium sp. LHD-71]|uniref:nucleoside diphosphate kinase regulator n=1 Tax=Bradyrhizobium sp. LHD-71 TaxID=3072141 RepID=UPI00280CA6BC|nr:nucleoside diphosphate kinase regulator [Bradyrhizobium sp. LHD-71]MDQ8732674.1 nucleoside diphosphate kinase regulator [Bradyrhizobium sp. LHD-71]